MANKKISDLAAGTTPLTDSDLLETEQPAEVAGTRSRKLTLAQVITWILSKTHAMTAAINEARADAVASAATVELGAIVGNVVHVTGTTTITAFDVVQAGTRRRVIFDGILLLTHNATSLILPTAANITTAAGDTAEFISEGAGNWKCVDYQRASGAALLGSGTLAGLTDVDVAGVADGEFLAYDAGTGKWIPATGGGGGGGGGIEKIAQVIVTGSAVTDIDFSSLNLDADSIYRLEAFVVPGATGAHVVSLLFSGDTTNGNYQRQSLTYFGTSLDVSRTNHPYIFYTDTLGGLTHTYSFSTTIKKASGAEPLSETASACTLDSSGNISITSSTHRWNSTANVTAIKLRNLVTNGFGVGTFVRLYRMN